MPWMMMNCLWRPRRQHGGPNLAPHMPNDFLEGAKMSPLRSLTSPLGLGFGGDDSCYLLTLGMDLVGG
jgi:hypothetical protein